MYMNSEAAPREVPSASDMRDPEQAAQWARIAQAKRPARETFFARFVAEICAAGNEQPAILELGSGPGFLARRILAARPQAAYTLLDFSPAMHDLARKELGPLGHNARFVEADFRQDGWEQGLGPFDFVVTLQAVHELRHKSRALAFHRKVRNLVRADGVFLLCDPYAGPDAMGDTELFMTVEEQQQALAAAGFSRREMLLRLEGLVLIRAA